MRHGTARQLLAEHALGLLTAADAGGVRRHLDDCPSCREEAASLIFATAGLAVIGALEPAFLHAAAPLDGQDSDSASRIEAAVGAALEATQGQRLLGSGASPTPATDQGLDRTPATGPAAVVRALSARRADAWWELAGSGAAGGAPAELPMAHSDGESEFLRAPHSRAAVDDDPAGFERYEGPAREGRDTGPPRSLPGFFDAADTAIPPPAQSGSRPAGPDVGRLFRWRRNRPSRAEPRPARDDSGPSAAPPHHEPDEVPFAAAKVPAAAFDARGDDGSDAAEPPAAIPEDAETVAAEASAPDPAAESIDLPPPEAKMPLAGLRTPPEASAAEPLAGDEQAPPAMAGPGPATVQEVPVFAADTGAGADVAEPASQGPGAGALAAQAAVAATGPAEAEPYSRTGRSWRARLRRVRDTELADGDFEDEWALLARFEGAALPAGTGAAPGEPTAAGPAAPARPERDRRATFDERGFEVTQDPRSAAADLSAATWVPGPEEHRVRRGLLGRRTPPPSHGPAVERPGEMQAAINELAVQPAGRPAAPRPHSFKESLRRRPERIRIDEDEDPRALVSFDEEVRRLSRPLPALPMRAGQGPGYMPAPVEWGLDRYDEDEDHHDEKALSTLVSSDLVSSNWRFWAIMLAVFSAVLFGIMVYGYLFLRDLSSERTQLEIASEGAAVPLRFVPVENPDPRFSPRATGYFEKTAGVALFYFTGLPLIERTQRFQLWAEGPAGTRAIGSASPFGGSTQTVEARNVPADTTRIFLTIESPVGESYPTQPQGLVLLEVDVP